MDKDTQAADGGRSLAEPNALVSHREDSPVRLPCPPDPQEILDRAVEGAILRAVINQAPVSRRRFMTIVGVGAVTAALSQVLPLKAVKAAIKERGPLEKKAVRIGFVPITCATPLILAEPMGFYQKYGLEVELIKTASWAVMRDKALAKDYEAEHMLSPMPLAITLGAGSPPVSFVTAAIENLNGQAITLHPSLKDRRDPKQWKGLKFAVPFEYSMHNFLLRYYLAEHGLDPEKDVEILYLPPPAMVAKLQTGHLDGFLSPDPFNQRAVFEGVGFIHILSREIWDGHPCCAFAASREFVTEMPNTFGALLRAIVDSTEFSAKAGNRMEVAKAITSQRYLDHPLPVVEQVLTGSFDDGLGNKHHVPGRIEFNPFPWHSMAVWILTQMKRWGYVKGEIDYKGIAEKVYLASECGEIMKNIGVPPPSGTYRNHTIMSKVFDPNKPVEYLKNFSIPRT